ncbi:class D sortase [Planococcus lenghuensis]|uniref:Class D sortase n=1 Tax=Planococcus lenghuensis TaxID=2213202 RepID=A0A1Q2L4Z1_9BACL|nr:class D sortase [Planococcus lenghuensis]AQQ55434.1 hypothetical protein B0X71_19930 [Planococcus lenghuensis]
MLRQAGILFVILGICLIGWNGYGWWDQTSAVTIDKEQAQSIDEKWNDRTQEATLLPPMEEGDDPVKPTETVEQKEVEQEEYLKTPSYEQGDEIGQLTIPKMGKIFPIHWGTDQQTLQKGVGVYDSSFTTLPNERRHTALAGHRDTVFIGLDQLAEGDRLYLEVEEKKYEYQIRDIWITDAEDRTVIVEKEKPTLTLTTCYPFDFIGSAPDRYIIQAELIKVEEVH